MPFTIRSFIPLQFNAIIGSPNVNDSIIFNGKPSLKDDDTAMFEILNSCGMFFLYPKK